MCRLGSWRSSGVADQHVHGVLHCTQTITTGDCNKQLVVCPASWGCWQVLGSVPPPTRLRKCLGTEGHLGAAISKGTDKQAEVQAKLKSAVPLQAATCQAARAGIDWSCNPCVCSRSLAVLDSQHVRQETAWRCLGPTGRAHSTARDLTSCNQDFCRSPWVVAHVQLGWGARAGWAARAVPLPAARRPRALG